MVNSNLFSRAKSGFKRLFNANPINQNTLYPQIHLVSPIEAPGTFTYEVDEGPEEISDRNAWPYKDSTHVDSVYSTALAPMPQPIAQAEITSVTPIPTTGNFLPTAVISDSLVIVKRPPLVQIVRLQGDGELNGFKTKVYYNRIEQMYKSLRKAKKKTFTAFEVQTLSGLETSIGGLITQLVYRGYIQRTGEKRRSRIFTGRPGPAMYTERQHTEYEFVEKYEPIKRGWGSLVGV
jgi:hypothetical protein